MKYSLGVITKAIEGSFKGADIKCEIEHILLDSRKLIYPSDSLFFAIRGKNHDGHKFIPQLIRAGVQSFVVDEKFKIQDDSVNYIVVGDVLDALQKLAGFHRRSFSYPVIGITGSNGKTIIKEWLYQLLSRKMKVIRSPKSFNSQVGVPLSVWNMEKKHEIALIEAGISQPGEMERLQKVIDPEIGLLTNIGDAHAQGFENETQKIHEKLKLFKDVKKLISRKEDDRISDLIGFFVEDHPNIEWITWSTETNADLTVFDIATVGDVTTVHANYRGKSLELEIPFTDEASIENAMHCVLMLSVFNFNEREIQQGIRTLHAIEMRLTQREGVNNCLVIDDYYNTDVKSLTLAIDFMEQQHRNGRKTVILSDILQSELEAGDLYGQVNQILKEKGIDRLIGVGENISANQDRFTIQHQKFYSSTDAFVREASLSEFSDETILLKGARPYSFELISRWLEKKSHGTVLEINLNALESNLNYFRSMVDPSTKIMVMMKAFGYGSGSHQVAKLLQFNGVDYLAVAYADEGKSLREDGITTPIMVMNPDESSMDTILEYKLQPNVYDLKIMKMLEDRLASRGPGKLQIHVELNTGMNRLGFDPDELSTLKAHIQRNGDIEVVSIFSHLAVADEKSKKAFTDHQAQEFKRMADEITSILPRKPLYHLLNTPGLLNFPEYQFDMVRLGIGIYGVDPMDRSNDMLENVNSLKSYISQIREVPAGQGVSYGLFSAATETRRIATIPVGYADGFDRGFSRGVGSMRVHGRDAKVVGNVCMDMTMLDVTNIPCEVGDTVTIFESADDLYGMAEKIETIPYEILTSISQRVKREYLRD